MQIQMSDNSVVVRQQSADANKINPAVAPARGKGRYNSGTAGAPQRAVVALSIVIAPMIL